MNFAESMKIVLAGAILLFVAAGFLHSAEKQSNRWIVILKPEALIKQVSTPQALAEHLINAANRHEPDQPALDQPVNELLAVYQHVFSGFSARLSSRARAWLVQRPEVAAIEADSVMGTSPLPQEKTPLRQLP